MGVFFGLFTLHYLFTAVQAKDTGGCREEDGAGKEIRTSLTKDESFEGLEGRWMGDLGIGDFSEDFCLEN